ncbi:amidohydrolase [Ahniella affigens]|uniref:Amidohydrolase n=2 Tax=Ahniella affigens TaxID=2021234 RepID=A0A2P1PYX2_9GAMM|nr:amidohydrolase [Ahniella affigens]
MLSWFIAASLSFGASAGELLIRADRIHTMDDERPQAEAMLVVDQKIADVGDFAELSEQHPDATVQDLRGHTVIPGLIDAHGHVLSLGLSLARADLVGTRDLPDVIARLNAAADKLPKDAWLLGRGWDQNDWPVQKFPSAADLDAAFPDRPVVLERVDGHATWINSAAIKRIGRSLDGDWQVDGGHIERVDGKPTGILIDAASALIDQVVPPLSAEDKTAAYKLAFSNLLAAGVTGVHDAGTSLDDLNVLKTQADTGALPIRLTTMADGDSAALAWLCKNGRYRHASGRLQMRTVKLYADGALGSRGAALLADYADDHGNRGLLVTSESALETAMQKAAQCGIQIATHAIGDRANRIVLDLYQSLAGQSASDRRWRIEHAQVLAPKDLARFAELNVIASMQPTHATSDMPWAETRLGPDRVLGAYAWRSLRDRGTRLALGSDFPVERIEPILGIYAAISRQDQTGQPDGGWTPNQRLTTYEALRGFTSDAAWAGFAESEVGQLKPGMLADFVVLDQDPFAVQNAAIPGLKVISTWVDGERAWPREPLPCATPRVEADARR